MSDAIYNEVDPFAAKWLEHLVIGGHIARGRVDQRSIAELRPADVAGDGQRHFFSGIGGWSYALRLAGVSDDADVWTGSCPCQPFSDAGTRGGVLDARHLWPAWFDLIDECRPPVIFGEQVASRAGLAWFDAVRADLERCGYAVGASDICAAGIGAPHIRQRLYFVAVSARERCKGFGLQLSERESRGNLPEIGGAAKLTRERESWATPAAREPGGTAAAFLMRKRKAKAKGASIGESLTNLSVQVQLVPWATPTARDWKAETAETAETADQTNRQALLTRGVTSRGSSVQTENRGRLNPSLSRWLMGYPPSWDICLMEDGPFYRRSSAKRSREPAGSGDTGTQSCHRSQRRSSKQQSKRLKVEDRDP